MFCEFSLFFFLLLQCSTSILRFHLQEHGYGIYVESGSSLTISKSCFVNNYIDGYAPVWVRSKSGLIASQDNYVSDGELTCRNHEAWKCAQPESKVCLAPVCDVSFKVYNARTQNVVATLTTNGTTTPCSINIEVVLPCLSTGVKKVRLELLRNGAVVRQRDETGIRYCLFGNAGSSVIPGMIASGTYTIRAVVNGIIQPKPVTFTLAGTCKL
jgi:hypothetical protein